MKPFDAISAQRESGTRANPDALLRDQGLQARMLTYGLSRREQEIALLAIGGLSNREIADRLFICEQTVKDHLYTTYTKLSIHRRSQLSQNDQVKVAMGFEATRTDR